MLPPSHLVAARVSWCDQGSQKMAPVKVAFVKRPLSSYAGLRTCSDDFRGSINSKKKSTEPPLDICHGYRTLIHTALSLARAHSLSLSLSLSLARSLSLSLSERH